ncbi:MAG TPA: YetF domain-containing protein [Candidatus Saccharimonadales bacterium]|nr:YetF domain-containing protein [Candidatus Saccharimonadales bacterium]
MLAGIHEGLNHALGLSLRPDELNILQISLRTILVFLYAIVIMRFAAKRFLARLTALDAILAFILASTLSRAINGSAPFFATLAASFLLIVLHRFFAWLTLYSHQLGNWVKGHEELLVENGKVHDQTMKKHFISREDLLEELRLNGNLASPNDVQQATLERSGQISVVKKKG